MALQEFFTECSRALDDNVAVPNDRRERIIKQSRDVTILSKRMIFLLHRATPQTLPAVLAEAAEKQAELLSLIRALRPELTGQRLFRHHRSVAGGVEEFVEAATFLRYASHGRVPSFAEMRAEFEAATGMPLGAVDYLTGLGDLTGELMRACLNAAARSDAQAAVRACEAVRDIERAYPVAELAAAGCLGGYGVRKKVDEMRNSVRKCEAACAALRLRGMEKVPGRVMGLVEEEEEEGEAEVPRPASAPRARGGSAARGRGRGRGRGDRGDNPAPMEDVETG
ncbi:Translin [Hyaloraphidium curvatum]|nr:Translin [Hyaloraphidium curvatum]